MLGFGFAELQAQDGSSFVNTIDGVETNDVTLEQGESFVLVVGIDNAVLVDAVTVTLNFDPTMLEVDGEAFTDLSGALLPFQFASDVNNETGYITLSKAIFGTAVEPGGFDVMEITFNVISDMDGTTEICHQMDGIDMSNIVHFGIPSLEDAPCVNVTIGEPVVFDCPELGLNIGDACDDGDDSTENDMVNDNCECVGEPIVVECLNDSQFPSAATEAGPTSGAENISTCSFEEEYSAITGIESGFEYEFTVSSGGYITVREGTFDGPVIASGFSPVTATSTDGSDLFVHWNTDDECGTASNCVVTTVNCLSCPEFLCPDLDANPGDSCDDGDETTYDDTVTENCECVGTPYDCTALLANIGDACDDGDETTDNDVVTENCECVGTPTMFEVDCEQPLTSTYCYGNSESSSWTYTVEEGTVLNLNFVSGLLEGGYDDIVIYDGASDADPVLYSTLDIPTGSGAQDLSVINVNSTGNAILMTLTSDGSVSCQSSSTYEGGWEWVVSCGESFDCPDLQANIGSACDDGDETTYDDVITELCECAGTPYDCTELLANIGDACDDGDDNTFGDVVTADCNCEGIQNVFEVSCDEPLAQNYCYGNNEDRSWTYSVEEGSIVNLAFSLGNIEGGYDDIVIYDGASDQDPVLYSTLDIPTGSGAQDLSEIDVTSTGNTIYMVVTSDGSVSCQSSSTYEGGWEWVVSCGDDCSVEAGVISYGDGSESQTICADDMEPSFVELAVVEAPSEGNSTAWVVTDTELNILAVGSQEDIEAIDFDNAGPGVCLIWLLDYDAENSNVGEVLESDMPNAGDIEGCFALSNSIEIVREECGPVYDCPELEANIGDPCDDGDDMTGNDMINADCECVGEPIVPSDCEDWVMYLNDNDGGETDLYGVELVGGNAELTFLTTIGYQGHIAYNETDNMVYVISNVDASYVKVNPHVSPVEVSEVMYLSEDVPSVTTAVFSPDGALLIGSATQDMIYSVDVLTNNVTVYDAYAPVNGGDIAFDDSGMLYLATRQGNGLYEVYPDGVWDDVLIGSLSNLVTGMALTQDGRLLTSHNGNANLEVRNTDGSNPGDTYALMLDGEAFDHNNGDMASGCNTFSDENEGDCDAFSTFYVQHGGQSGVSGSDLYSVMYSGDDAVLSFLTNVDFEAHIGYNAEDDIVYLVNVNGNFVRAYDPTLGMFLGDLPLIDAPSGLVAVVYNSADGLLYVGSGGPDAIYTVDLGTGQTTFFADAPVSGGDLSIQDGGLYLSVRTAGELYEITGGGNNFIGNIIDGVNGAARANNSTGIVGANATTTEFVEYNIADASVANTYTAMLDGSPFTLWNGDMAAGCGDDEPIIVPEGECYAVATEEYVEGTQLDNSPLLAERADPNNALGAPEGIDALVFTTLGYGGSITVSFDGSVPNGEGDDIEVVETSYNNPGCASYPEYATVEVSMDGVNWATAGTVCKGDPFVDISDAGDYEYVMYVRVTNDNDLSTSSDGFDVDGIVALHNCEEDGDGGEGVEDLLSVDSQNQLTSFPNPTNGPSQVVFVTAETGRTLVEVYDMNGRMVEALFNQEAEAGVEYRLDFNGNNLPNGVYIYRMTTENEVIVDKFMIAK